MPINQVPSLLHRPKKLIFPIQLMKYMCFPILRKLVGYILKSVRFREELFQETLILKKQGKKSFFDSGEVLDRFWNDFFARKTFSELHGLENRLELNLDELSKEVASRFFYSRYIAQLNGILSFSATGYLEPLKPYYPLDAEEQERLIRLGKTFQLKYDLPKHLIISNTQTVTAFGMSYFPAQIQKTLEGRDVIDGGSFAGDSAMIFTEYCPRMVYAFEPNPYTYVEMQNILDLNKGKLGTSGDKGGGGNCGTYGTGRKKWNYESLYKRSIRWCNFISSICDRRKNVHSCHQGHINR
jgi:hypothetical protein